MTLITRYGAKKVDQHLATHIEAVKGSGHPVVWICDPMHGKWVFLFLDFFRSSLSSAHLSFNSPIHLFRPLSYRGLLASPFESPLTLALGPLIAIRDR